MKSIELSGLTMVALAEQARHVCSAEPAAEDQRAAPGSSPWPVAAHRATVPERAHQGLRTRQVAPAMAMTRSCASTMRAEATIVLLP